MKRVLRDRVGKLTQKRTRAFAKILTLGLALGTTVFSAQARSFSATDILRSHEAHYCVSKVAIYGKAPVLDRPDGHNVLYRLSLGRCDLRITDSCHGLWCHVTFKGGKGWIFRTFLTENKT